MITTVNTYYLVDITIKIHICIWKKVVSSLPGSSSQPKRKDKTSQNMTVIVYN